ncbi:MAG: pyridoxal phosphate-dependent aminotransferase [Planctomycetaceae bacterium]|nr:pyridoxal phosphate-dependent aminotransferase [Planctomycetaceae bacterium]
MRTNIVHEGAGFLEYEIRQIVEHANRMRGMGQKITWENIGDPIAMKEEVAPWIKEIVRDIVSQNASWGYCQTRGVQETRDFLADRVNAREGGVQISPDDIIFFNGTADAIDKVYELTHRNARILLPAPIYSTHSSNESKRGGYDPLHFRLDPKNNWLPDMEEVRRIVHYNPSIAGIGFVNPDNPTGIVYPREILEEFAEIARQYDLFLLVDEIYSHICYNGAEPFHLSQYAHDVPAISMRGISKEYPWPGARCAWIEVLNKNKDPNFSAFIDSILASKMLEVCATTLPQISIPRVFGSPKYPEHLRTRAEIFEKRANQAYDIFSKVPGLICHRPQGAFYMSVVFEDGVFHPGQKLQAANPQLREYVDALCQNVPGDKRFVYNLLASKGICIVPLTGFATDLCGFRVTMLNTDDAVRNALFQEIADSVTEFLNS